MNLIQQFLEQNLTKDLNHQLLQQIQNSNQSVQVLISNLEQLRSKQSYTIIQNKIKRIQNYLQLKNDIINNLNLINQSNAIFQWLLNSLVQQGFIYELIKKEQYIIQKQLIQIARKIFYQNNYQRNHIQQTDIYKKLIKDLQILNQQRPTGSLKGLNRQRIIQIDAKLKSFQDKIQKLSQNVQKFNIQILVFVKNIYSFQQRIRSQFANQFSLNMTNNNTNQNIKISQQTIQQPQKYSRNASQKSHISINSHHQDNQFKKSISRKNIYQTQQHTPRKQLIQTPKYDEFQQQFDRKKRASLNFENNNRRASQIINLNYQNKKGSDMMSNTNSYLNLNLNSRWDVDELRNMGKTLGNFNYHRPSQISNPLYTTTNLGGKVRLPTNWNSKNSRSSISYYPPR